MGKIFKEKGVEVVLRDKERLVGVDEAGVSITIRWEVINGNLIDTVILNTVRREYLVNRFKKICDRITKNSIAHNVEPICKAELITGIPTGTGCMHFDFEFSKAWKTRLRKGTAKYKEFIKNKDEVIRDNMLYLVREILSELNKCRMTDLKAVTTRKALKNMNITDRMCSLMSGIKDRRIINIMEKTSSPESYLVATNKVYASMPDDVRGEVISVVDGMAEHFTAGENIRITLSSSFKDYDEEILVGNIKDYIHKHIKTEERVKKTVTKTMDVLFKNGEDIIDAVADIPACYHNKNDAVFIMETGESVKDLVCGLVVLHSLVGNVNSSVPGEIFDTALRDKDQPWSLVDSYLGPICGWDIRKLPDMYGGAIYAKGPHGRENFTPLYISLLKKHIKRLEKSGKVENLEASIRNTKRTLIHTNGIILDDMRNISTYMGNNMPVADSKVLYDAIHDIKAIDIEMYLKKKFSKLRKIMNRVTDDE